MDKNQEAFLLELIADFKIEAAEHHKAIVNGLLKLEKNPPSSVFQPLIETVFREIHSLKGAARAVNQLDIERLCQSIESVFHLAKQGTIAFTSQAYDTLYKAADFLGVMLLEIELKEKRIGPTALIQLIRRLEMLQQQKVVEATTDTTVSTVSASQKLPAAASISGTKSPEPSEAYIPTGQIESFVTGDTVRIATSKLGILLREAEEFITAKETLGFYLKEIKKKHVKELNPVVQDMEQFHHSLSRMIDDLLLDIKTTLLYPFSSLLEIVPKIVRDLGKDHGKEIQLSIQGGETEIDRRILEGLKDPLIHLIRNSIDHGIESPKIRMQRGKPAAGSVEIHIKNVSGREVEMIIQDDGAGVDRDKVVQSAFKLGILTSEAAGAMSDKEIGALIFRSGVSTSPFVTDISGRGLGMAIVAEKITGLGGSIEMDSIPEKGTSFRITLPVTISTFRGLLVQSSGQSFIIPTSAVEKAVRIRPDEIRTVESRKIISSGTENVPLVGLGEVLGIPSGKFRKEDQSYLSVLILVMARRKIAFLVDEIVGEHEGMVKDMGPQLLHVTNIAGATVLGNGRVIPILNIKELLESAVQTVRTDHAAEFLQDDQTPENQSKYILVAEDSITLRSLLRNIIETSGYRVKTAVDGMEALEFLKNETFDLVVSDVEMPRLSGFDLTARIRIDKRLTETPVILVTALDSADDRQRGMECGANAYIVKGSFEQSNLLEMIHRLI
jgi:two-component system chemotaxis sensor kinase CheA